MITWAKTKGAYRFFSNEKVEPKLILDSHKDTTVRRPSGKEIILAVQDTTDINHSDVTGAKSIGYINDLENVHGYFYHPTLAVTVDGTPLGISDSQVWVRNTYKKAMTAQEKKVLNRKTPITEKENNKCLESYKTLSEIEMN